MALTPSTMLPLGTALHLALTRQEPAAGTLQRWLLIFLKMQPGWLGWGLWARSGYAADGPDYGPVARRHQAACCQPSTWIAMAKPILT